MLRVRPNAVDAPYPLDLDSPTNLNGIACRGRARRVGGRRIGSRVEDGGWRDQLGILGIWKRPRSLNAVDRDLGRVACLGRGGPRGAVLRQMMESTGSRTRRRRMASSCPSTAMRYGHEAFAVDHKGDLWWFSSNQAHSCSVRCARGRSRDVDIAEHGEHLVAWWAKQGAVWVSHDGGASFRGASASG